MPNPNYSPEFIAKAHEVIKEYGLDSVKRWSHDPNPQFAQAFKDALEAVSLSAS